jgi:hypothetical protein
MSTSIRDGVQSRPLRKKSYRSSSLWNRIIVVPGATGSRMKNLLSALRGRLSSVSSVVQDAARSLFDAQKNAFAAMHKNLQQISKKQNFVSANFVFRLLDNRISINTIRRT